MSLYRGLVCLALLALLALTVHRALPEAWTLGTEDNTPAIFNFVAWRTERIRWAISALRSPGITPERWTIGRIAEALQERDCQTVSIKRRGQVLVRSHRGDDD